LNANPHANRLISFFAFAWFFCILGGYYVIRPIRDTMGVASGRDSLNWLFLGTFVAMLVAGFFSDFSGICSEWGIF